MKKILIFTLLSFLACNTFAQLTVNEEGIYLGENNEPYNGPYIENYPSGEVKLEIFLKDGLLHGKYLSYFENGNVNEIRTYSEGIKENRWETFNSQGMKISEANFLNDMKHGKWLVWDENGVLRYDMEYTEGDRSGIWRIYNEKGEKISEKEYSANG